MNAKFGPAGTAESFKEMGYKKSVQLPEYLGKFGLDCFEYQCGQGVRVTEKAAREIGKAFADSGLTLSVHAPYFISLSSVEEEKRLNSINYILQSARALELAKDTMRLAKKALDEEGLSHIHCCPETMGKVNQLGTLEEVLEICTVDESFIPCIEFGHLNARTFGGITSASDYEKMLNMVENKLGHDRLANFHSHFSKIMFTNPGGEKKHLTFADNEGFGPDFEPLMELIAKKNLHPTFICESAGTQTEDAKTMRDNYYSYLK